MKKLLGSRFNVLKSLTSYLDIPRLILVGVKSVKSIQDLVINAKSYALWLPFKSKH